MTRGQQRCQRCAVLLRCLTLCGCRDCAGADEPCTLSVSYRDDDIALPSEAALGMLLEQVASFVVRSEGLPATHVAIGASQCKLLSFGSC